jgi:AcrR family transcriptional regulator
VTVPAVTVPEGLRTQRSPRAAQLVAAALELLEAEGPDALTMRHLADAVGIRAPSIYKHLPDKAALEAALIEEALVAVGAALHAAVARPGRRGAVRALLGAYRPTCVERPHLYRLATAGPLPHEHLPADLHEWAGEPFFLATGDPYRSQALWSLAHGMVILEIDDRFPAGSDLTRTWRAAADAFADR